MISAHYHLIVDLGTDGPIVVEPARVSSSHKEWSSALRQVERRLFAMDALTVARIQDPDNTDHDGWFFLGEAIDATTGLPAGGRVIHRHGGAPIEVAESDQHDNHRHQRQ